MNAALAIPLPRPQSVRLLLVCVHRYAGLAMTAFLVIASLTGSILAFAQELERLFSPPLHVSAMGRKPLDPGILAEQALRLVPGATLNAITLRFRPEESYKVTFDSPTQKQQSRVLSVTLDPYTGAELARETGIQGPRGYPFWPITRHNVMNFIRVLHYSLAIPGSAGVLLFGIVAVIWTVDCFVGLFLTLPPRRRGSIDERDQTRWTLPRRFLQRWAIAWKVRLRGSAFRVNFDLHRAFGLWLWLMLLVFAWSSVCLTLNDEVYQPVMQTLFGLVTPYLDPQPLPQPRLVPAIGWIQAHRISRRLMSEQAAHGHFSIDWEDVLNYDSSSGAYTFIVHTSRDIASEWGSTAIAFDGESGKFLGFNAPSGQNGAATFTTWITTLHFAAIGGLPMKIFVSTMGFVIAMLAITGVVIWRRKRKSGRFSRLRGAAFRRETKAPQSAG